MYKCVIKVLLLIMKSNILNFISFKRVSFSLSSNYKMLRLTGGFRRLGVKFILIFTLIKTVPQGAMFPVTLFYASEQAIYLGKFK